MLAVGFLVPVVATGSQWYKSVSRYWQLTQNEDGLEGQAESHIAMATADSWGKWLLVSYSLITPVTIILLCDVED